MAGIAGRLIKDLGIDWDDWDEAVDLMQQELSADGEARSVEDSVIATSLNAIKGPHATPVKVLLKAFGLVPEDCKCPLPALAWIYEAVLDPAGDSSKKAPTIAQLRRW